MNVNRARTRVLLASVLVLLLPGCGGLTGQPGVSCATEASFEGVSYTGDRIIDSRATGGTAEQEYGASIGTASPTPCEGLDSDETYPAYRIPQVDPADGILVVDGQLSVYLRKALAEADPATLPAPLVSFMRAHPAATDM